MSGRWTNRLWRQSLTPFPPSRSERGLITPRSSAAPRESCGVGEDFAGAGEQLRLGDVDGVAERPSSLATSRGPCPCGRTRRRPGRWPGRSRGGFGRGPPRRGRFALGLEGVQAGQAAEHLGGDVQGATRGHGRFELDELGERHAERVLEFMSGLPTSTAFHPGWTHHELTIVTVMRRPKPTT